MPTQGPCLAGVAVDGICRNASRGLVRAVEAYGAGQSDFADWLVGFSDLESGLEFTLAFDRDAARRRALRHESMVEA